MTAVKRILRLFMVCLAISGRGLFIFASWPQISAKVWHWRYGYSICVGDYEIPVPGHWQVRTSENPAAVTLVDTRVKRTTVDPLGSGNVINVDIRPAPLQDFDFWIALRRKQLKDLATLREIEEKTLQAGDERIVCLGGHELRAISQLPTTLVSLQCYSTGRLYLAFTGHQTDEFYAIASQIHHKRK